MPKVKDTDGIWYDVEDVIARGDGLVMSFKIKTRDHGKVTVIANLPPEDWKTFLDFVGRTGGGAGMGVAFGPIGAIIGGALGILSFLKAHDDDTPGYLYTESKTRYFSRLYNTHDNSSYRA
jgi:hypothetical protein